MSIRGNKAESTVKSFLSRIKRRDDKISLDTSLYAEGIGLDSLETAELSAILEDELGSDPFSQGEMPQTLGDIVAFYGDEGESGADTAEPSSAKA